MKGYKAFGKGLICRGKQYAENTIFEEERAEICKSGMHFCKSPLAVLGYYPLVNEKGEITEFAEVEALDECKTDDNEKYCTKRLKVGAKVDFANLVKASVEFDYEKIEKEKKHDANNEKITSKNKYAQIGSSGDSAKIGSSGDYAKIGSSGDYAQIGSSGDSAKIGSSGDSAQIGSSGCSAKIGSSGDSAKIGSSGDYAQIGSSGDSAKIGSSGNYAKIGSSGYSAQIGSSGDSAKIGSSGYSAQIGSSGDSAKIGSSGDSAQIGSSGCSAKIGSSGNYAQITSEGKYAVVCCAGNNSIAKAKIGSWITLAEWGYNETEHNYIPKCVKTEYVDGDKIKEDVFYKLVNGEFMEIQN